jgi:hypothetical protein
MPLLLDLLLTGDKTLHHFLPQLTTKQNNLLGYPRDMNVSSRNEYKSPLLGRITHRSTQAPRELKHRGYPGAVSARVSIGGTVPARFCPQLYLYIKDLTKPNPHIKSRSSRSVCKIGINQHGRSPSLLQNTQVIDDNTIAISKDWSQIQKQKAHPTPLSCLKISLTHRSIIY